MKFFRPTLEELEPRFVPSGITDKEIKTMLESMDRIKKTLAAPKTVITRTVATTVSATARASSGGGSRPATSANISGGSVRLTNKKNYSLETSFIVHDPAIQLANTAVTDNKLQDTIAELGGRGGRDKRSGRFLGHGKPKPPEPPKTPPKPPETKKPAIPPKKQPEPIKLPEIVLDEEIEAPLPNDKVPVEPKGDS